jgi:hypothetical protein
MTALKVPEERLHIELRAQRIAGEIAIGDDVLPAVSGGCTGPSRLAAFGVRRVLPTAIV